jgi:SAM-dependent methyltransferase
MNYRDRVYAHYTSQKMPEALSRTEGEALRWSQGAAHRLRDWLPGSRDAVILDLGCGPGNMLHLLRGQGYRRVTGVDISPEQVRVASSVGFPVVNSDLMGFLAGRSDDTDCIILFDVIEHFTKDELFTFLDACHRALRPGGIFILQTPNAESPWGAMHRYHDITHETGFDPASLDHVLRVAGFGSFQARECGPVVHGVRSAVRWMIWRLIAAWLAVWNLAETGTRGSGIYTRIFVARVVKPAGAATRAEDR